MREQRHELLAILAQRVRPHERTLADEIALRRVHDPSHPEVVRRDRAVGLLSDDHVALLCPEDVHRLGPVRDGARRDHGVPDVTSVP